MGNLLADGIAWLDDKRQQSLSSTVRYHRGEQFVNILATPAKTMVETIDEAGNVVNAPSPDFIVSRSDLIFGGTISEPRSGDRIIYNGHSYEVLSLAGGEVAAPSDPFGFMLRVHTKRIGDAPW